MPYLFHPLELWKGRGALVPKVLEASRAESSSQIICMAANGIKGLIHLTWRHPLASRYIVAFKWRIITTLDRKLLGKQKVQNRFASDEVHIGHFFYNVKATVSFGNRLNPSIFRFKNFSPDWQTELFPQITVSDRRTLRALAYAHGVMMDRNTNQKGSRKVPGDWCRATPSTNV